MNDVSPTLTEFFPRYENDDNEWWALGSGDHMNLFDEAMERVESLRSVLGDLCAAAEKVFDDAFRSDAYGKGEMLLDVHGSYLLALQAAVVKARQVRGEG